MKWYELLKIMKNDTETLFRLIKGLEKYYQEYGIYMVAKISMYMNPLMHPIIAYAKAQYIDHLINTIAEWVYDQEDYWGE